MMSQIHEPHQQICVRMYINIRIIKKKTSNSEFRYTVTSSLIGSNTSTKQAKLCLRYSYVGIFKI